jgi:uncharacterized protein YjbI with pentapeptide repeats
VQHTPLGRHVGTKRAHASEHRACCRVGAGAGAEAHRAIYPATGSMPPRVGGGWRGRNGKNGPYKSKDFLQKQKQLRQLLIPFDEEKLSTRAGEALALLRDHPDLLDYSIVQALVEEKVTEKLEEGEADNYGMGFGEAKHRQVTSEWSRWVTFAGDTDTWPGERLKKRAGFTSYLTQDPSRNRIKREYSDRVAVCVAILKLVYQDLHAADAVGIVIRDIAHEVRERGTLTEEQLVQLLREDGRLERVWTTDSSIIRGHKDLPDGGLLGDSKQVVQDELRAFIAMIHGETVKDAVANEGKEGRTARKAQLKRDAKIRQQVQILKSRFQKAGANSGVAEMLSLLCVRQTLTLTTTSPRGSRNTSTDMKHMKRAISMLQNDASGVDLDGDGILSMHDLTQLFTKARATAVAGLLCLISIRKQLVGCDLRGARLDDMLLQFADMEGCDLAGASLVRTNLEWSDMMGGDFTGADFTEATLADCDMRDTKLSCAVLPDRGKEEDAVGVSFFRSHLAKCNFRGAHMSFADLREADARQAIFTAAILQHAQFEPLGGGGVTDLRQAFFDDADLTGSVGLEETQFNELKPRKMKPFVLHKMTVLKFVQSILPSSVPDDADDLDDDDDEGDEDEEEEDEEEEEEEDEEDDGDDEADDDDDGDMDAEEDGDNVEDDEGEEEEGDEEGSSPKAAGGESDLAASAAAKGASDQAKQQLLRAKKADRDRVELFHAQEDTLIQECKSRRVDQPASQPARLLPYLKTQILLCLVPCDGWSLSTAVPYRAMPCCE